MMKARNTIYTLLMVALIFGACKEDGIQKDLTGNFVQEDDQKGCYEKNGIITDDVVVTLSSIANDTINVTLTDPTGDILHDFTAELSDENNFRRSSDLQIDLEIVEAVGYFFKSMKEDTICGNIETAATDYLAIDFVNTGTGDTLILYRAPTK